MIPKNIALAGPERSVLALAPVIWAFVTVLRPVIRVINAVASAFLRLVGVRLQDEVSSTFTREEVAALVEESRGEGLLADDEYDRLAGALGFTEKTVAAVRLAPESLTTVVRGSSAADVEALCAATGYSRFPVADEAGELLGYLHIKDVLAPDDEVRELPIDDQLVPPVRAGRGVGAAARGARGAPAARCAHGARRRRRRGDRRGRHAGGRHRGARRARSATPRTRRRASEHRHRAMLHPRPSRTHPPPPAARPAGAARDVGDRLLRR